MGGYAVEGMKLVARVEKDAGSVGAAKFREIKRVAVPSVEARPGERKGSTYILSMCWSWINQRRHWGSKASSSRDGEGPTTVRNEGALIRLHWSRQFRPRRDVAILIRLLPVTAKCI
jgi:hypothetical protein